MRAVTARALIRKLRETWLPLRPPTWIPPDWRCGNCQTVVPVHAGDLTPGTLRSIERDLGPCLGSKWLTK